MEREKLESLIIDYIDNKLNSVDRHMVEQELVKNADAYKVYEELREVMHVMDRSARLEPSSKLKSGFEQALTDEMATTKSGRTIFFQPVFYRVAAAVALLLMGAMIGYYYSKQNDARLAEIEKKMEEQRQQMEFTNKMLAMMTNDQSASQRIQGVNVAMTVEKVDDKIVKALVKTLNEDPNTNVRLAALEALGKFHQEKNVREHLIQSLSIQKDPVIQIELIQMMVQMKEKSVVDDLQKIVDDVETMMAVKDEAYSGIMKLS
jgi:hypothetical protein